jgi:hypothetical protein
MGQFHMWIILFLLEYGIARSSFVFATTVVMAISYEDNICFFMEYGMLRQFAIARVARSSLVFATAFVMAISLVLNYSI